MRFVELLHEEVMKSLKNNFSDNFDYIILGNEPKEKHAFSLKDIIKNFLYKKDIRHIQESINYLRICFQKAKLFSFLYNKLENEESKSLLIKIVAYRILGHRKVKLPLNTKEYWQGLEKVESLADKSKFINPNFMHFILNLYDLRQLGYDLKIYFVSLGILIDFVIKQYELNQKDKIIKVKEGDTVFDCGGCWGDTALFFASSVGDKGKVFSIEFIPSNLQILRTNLELNPMLMKTITIVEQPLFSIQNIDLHYKDNGPASLVREEPFIESDGLVKTTTIDEIVRIQEINKVDFIKMDIEGAELSSLKGAINTIKKFKPTLSIAIYHSELDFYDIPTFIDDLKLGYKFYINHNTINQSETVLFAEV